MSAVSAAADEYNRGVTLYIQKNYPQAREALLRTVEADPAHGDALYFLGQIEKKDGNYDLALGYLQRSLNGRLSPQYRKLASWDVIILSKQRQDYKTMIRQAREYWERTGDQSARTQADQIVNQMIWTDNQTAADEYTRGTGLRDAGKSAESRAAMQNALREDPAFLAARFELGLADYRENRPREATAHFRAVADRVPFHGAAHLLLGNIEFEQQHYREGFPGLTMRSTSAFSILKPAISR
jgi:tetratricopeptide (TPR) repeat protein